MPSRGSVIAVDVLILAPFPSRFQSPGLLKVPGNSLKPTLWLWTKEHSLMYSLMRFDQLQGAAGRIFCCLALHTHSRSCSCSLGSCVEVEAKDLEWCAHRRRRSNPSFADDDGLCVVYFLVTTLSLQII